MESKAQKLIMEAKRKSPTKSIFVDGHFVASSSATSKEDAIEKFKKAFPEHLGKNIKVEDWLVYTLLSKLEEDRK
jgi:hypothetical protein